MSFTTANLRNGGLRNSVSFGQFFTAYDRAQSSNFFNLLITELKTTVSTAFFHHIRHVLTVRSKPKMAGINAGRVISARTVMKHIQPIRDASMMDKPADSMGVAVPSVVASGGDFTVANSIGSPFPKPAFVRILALFNLRPKSLENRLGESLRNDEGERSVVLFSSHVLGRALGWSNIAGVFSFCGIPTLTSTSV